MCRVKFSLLFLFSLMFGFCTLIGMVGCDESNDSNLYEVTVNGKTITGSYKMNVWRCARDLNHMAGLSQYDDGIAIESNDDFTDYRIYMTEELEDMLPSICENYNASTNWTENITPEQVKSGINDDFSSVFEAYRSEDWESYFLCKLFKWCGTSCKDFVVYDESSGRDRTHFEKDASSGSTTNYNVIVGQSIAKETGVKTAYKFKWQE